MVSVSLDDENIRPLLNLFHSVKICELRTTLVLFPVGGVLFLCMAFVLKECLGVIFPQLNYFVASVKF